MKLVYNDRLHKYWWNDQVCKGVTGVANYPDDKYRIQQSEKKKLAIGLALKPKLIEKVAANIDNNAVLEEAIEEAKEAGGAHEGRDRGTTAHTITERHDLGKFIVDTPLSAEIIPGWQKLIGDAGLTILPEYVESMIIYPDRLIAGRLDRIVRMPDGTLRILDVKGGYWVLRYPRTTSIQLAFYAHAPLIARNIRETGDRIFEATEFEPMPEVDQRWALVAHFPEDGPPELHDWDISKGWNAVQRLCYPTIQWRETPADTFHHPHRLLPVGLRPTPAPGWMAPDEGVVLTDPDMVELRDEFKACPDQARINAWLAEAVTAGRSFNPAHGRTHRRRQIIRAAISWAPFEDDIVYAAMDLACEGLPDLSNTIGYHLGSMTVDQASRLHYFGQQIQTGGLLLTFSEDGTPVLVDAQPTAV